MNLTKSNWYFILLILVVLGAIGANELGFGFISLILLFPAVLLMQALFADKKPGE
jgi:hypothetical protein